MKTRPLSLLFMAALAACPVHAADPAPAVTQPSSSLPTADEYKAQDAAVRELQHKLEAETRKLNAMKSTFVDTAPNGRTAVASTEERHEWLQKYEDDKRRDGKARLAEARGDNPDTGAFDVDRWLLSFRVFF